ncbi:UPF0481 protein At3g47200-like isoform X1 [Carex rostrata]
MDPEIKVASDAEAPEKKVASAAKGLETESTCATKGPEIDRPLLFTTESPDCIFRASGLMRAGRESDFVPKSVSIGPYYHGRENLKRMEDIKVQCMSDLWKMRSVGGSNLDRVPVDRFMRFESKARRFYKEKFDLSDVKFIEMLVLDSFFVIRIMLHVSGYVDERMDLNIKEAVSDLLLLENQIPLFFIKEVWDWLNLCGDVILLFHLIGSTFRQLDLPWWIKSDTLPKKSDHLLHFYWKISEASTKKKIKEDHADPMQRMIKLLEKVRSGRSRGPSQKLIVNATELHQTAGISFKNVKIDHHNGDCVEFSKGIIWMPSLKIDSSQTTLLVNLVAFENSMFLFHRTISTYIKIMDDLIDSSKDVELLQKSGVVYNTLSSHTEAATFFNNIGNLCFIDYEDNPFSYLFENVNKYYKSCWNRHWANLRQNYFNSPWSVIAVLAGTTLLFLAGAQTYYTVFPKN